MTEEFKTLLFLPEALGLVPRARERGLTAICNFSSRDPVLFAYLQRHQHRHDIPLHTHVKKENFKK